MKKILFISYCLPPYLYPQSIQVGRFLNELKKSYDIHIVTAETSARPDPTLYPNIYDGIAADKIIKVHHSESRYINYIKGRAFPFLSKCPDHYKSWIKRAYEDVTERFCDQNFAAILTFSYPLSLNILGKKLKDHFHCPWIAHQSDPWSDNPFNHYGPLTSAINKSLERLSFESADHLIFTSSEAKNFFIEKYPQMSDKISYIDHSFDSKLFTDIHLENNPTKIIRYVGGFYGDRTARPLMDALSRLSTHARKNLKFEIVGGNIKTKMIVKGAGLPTDLISVTDRVQYGESLKKMKESAVLLVIDAPLEKKENIFFPSKLVDYLAARRPIIGISNPGPTFRILNDFGYACFSHDQTNGLVQLLEDIAAGKVLAVSDNDSAYNIYSPEHNGHKLVKTIESLTNE